MYHDIKIYTFGNLFLSIFFLIALLSAYLWTEITGEYGAIVFILLLISIVNLYRFRKAFFIFIVIFFSFLFPFDFVLSFFSNVPLLPYYRLEYLGLVFLLLSLFQLMLLGIKVPKYQVSFESLSFIKTNSYVIFLLLAVLLMSILFLKGSNIFESGVVNSYKAYQENLSRMSGYNEYIIIFSLFVHFFKKTKLQKTIFILLLAFLAVKLISFGFRVQSVMVLILIMINLFQKGLDSKFSIMFVLFGFLIVLLFGFVKEGQSMEEFSLSLLVDDRYGYIQSHQHGVLSSSSVILEVYGTRTYIVEKLLDLGGSILAGLIPRAIIGDSFPNAYPSAFVQTTQYTPGGGFFLVQVYSLVGWVGVLLTLSYMRYMLNAFLNRKRQEHIKEILNLVFVTVFIVFFPRWMSYDFFNFMMRTYVTLLLLICAFYLIKLSSIKR